MLQKKIAPVNLFGTRKVFTYRQCEEPAEFKGTSFYWQTLVEIDIESMHHAHHDGNPGVWINKDRKDSTCVFIPMDDDTLHTDRESCLEVIREINQNTLAQVTKAREEAYEALQIAEKQVEEMESIQEMLKGIITNMK